jgi:hypothetical protein
VAEIVKKTNAFDRVKKEADRLAEISANVCRTRAPNPVVAALIQTNYRFFRRMAGLSGRDATERKE